MSWRDDFYEEVKASTLKTNDDVLNFIMEEFKKLVAPLDEIETGLHRVDKTENICELKIGDRRLVIDFNESNRIKLISYYVENESDGDRYINHDDKRVDFELSNGVFVDGKGHYITSKTIDDIFKKTFYKKSAIQFLS